MLLSGGYILYLNIAKPTLTIAYTIRLTSKLKHIEIFKTSRRNYRLNISNTSLKISVVTWPQRTVKIRIRANNVQALSNLKRR